MAELPGDGLGRRRVDRRRGRDRRLLWRGVERRHGDRRLATAAAGLVVAALLSAPRSAEAQIHSWRDGNGTLVLSSQPLDPGATRVDMGTAPGVDMRTASSVQTLKAPAQRRRGAEFDSFIDEQAAAHGIRPELIRGVIQAESNFNARARSSKGAMGLMQLMPATAAELGVRNPFDALENIRGGTAYLRWLLKRYGGNETLALAAYNAGPGAVDRYGSRVPPYQETQQYVTRILAAMPAAAAAAVASSKVIYKTTEVIDGYSVPRYSTSKPASGPYEVMKLG